MNFKHKQLNKTFGFPDNHFIPFIRINNPLVAVLEIQKMAKKANTRFGIQKDNEVRSEEEMLKECT